MTYFKTNSQREDAVYYEFFKGEWDDDGFWKEDSIYLHEDFFVEHPEILDIFKQNVPEFDPEDISLVNVPTWNRLKMALMAKEGVATEFCNELAPWAEDTLVECGSFSVIGV